MKKSQLNNLKPGSAAHVVAHAHWTNSRGRKPSMTYTSVSGRHFSNPEQALVVAEYEAMILDLEEDTPQSTVAIAA